jgi:SAM-dependent methyltransferase
MKNSNKFLDILYKYRISKNLVYGILKARAKDLANIVAPYLTKGEIILDIGPASCTVTESLMKQGLKIFPLDIENFSIVDTVLPTIYDGLRMPFKDNQFDTSLILFVLHHTSDPTELLLEAKRVSKKILVFEDIVTSAAHKYMTATLDNLMNLEFYDQPHSNKSDEEWQTLFNDLGFKLLNREYRNSGMVIKRALYFLEKKI